VAVSSDPATVPAALAAALRANQNAPLITYYDERLGERTELSAVTLDNWVAKTANLLVDGAALGPDDSAAVLLPAHWQTAAVLLGCLTAGVPVRFGAAATGPVPADVAFAAVDRAEQARAARPAETYLLGLAPMALPLREVPDGALDYVVAVRAFGDRYSSAPADPSGIAWYEPEPVSQTALADRARRHAGESGLLPGGRLLVPVDAEPDPVAWLFAPLLLGASVVLVRNADPERLDAIAATERVTIRT
jgi:uncharacterized protein (TIGR03089 family)